MKIECVPVYGRKQHLSICLDEESWKVIHTSIFGRIPALPQGCLSQADFSPQFDLLEYRLAKQYVIRRLSAQNLPSATLLRALHDRLVSDEVAQRVVQEFQQQGYVNDSEWTNSFVRMQMQRKQGPRAIAQKLAMKGLPKEQVEKSLKLLGGVSQQRSAIAQLLTTRFKQRDLTDFREKQKVIGALVRRGFDLSIILEEMKLGFDFE